MEKYISNYRFKVEIHLNGRWVSDVNFSKVSGIQSEINYEELQEGGFNEGVHILPNPGRKSATLVLERGVAKATSWVTKAEPGMRLGTTLAIKVMEESGNDFSRMYVVEDGIVVKKEIGQLDALGREVLIDKLEIMYSSLEKV